MTSTSLTGDVAMAQWYELRVEGSAGTQSGRSRQTREGIAIGDSGRLCSITTGQAMRFASQEQAMDYLGRTTLPGPYRFEAVPCGDTASREHPSAHSSAPPA